MGGIAPTTLIKDTPVDVFWKTPSMSVMTLPLCGMKEMIGSMMIGMLAVLVAIVVMNSLMM
jgi:hypothetical protein